MDFLLGSYLFYKLLIFFKNENSANSLAVQWLGLHAFTAQGPDSIPHQGIEIPQAAQCSKKKKKRKVNSKLMELKELK